MSSSIRLFFHRSMKIRGGSTQSNEAGLILFQSLPQWPHQNGNVFYYTVSSWGDHCKTLWAPSSTKGAIMYYEFAYLISYLLPPVTLKCYSMTNVPEWRVRDKWLWSQLIRMPAEMTAEFVNTWHINSCPLPHTLSYSSPPPLVSFQHSVDTGCSTLRLATCN